MKTNWTDQQLSAIEAKGKGIVVSAAAGSGKTAVLIERTIRLLSDENAKIPADTLLAVTFTNAAAAQLRDKLSSALAEKTAQFPDNRWLAAQQSRLQMAKIQTINAFCLDIVKNNAHALGLQSGLRILEENDVIIIENEMFEKAVNDFYEDRMDDIELLHSKMCRKKSDIISAAKAMYKYLRSVAFSERYMTASIEKLKSRSAVNKYCCNIMSSKLALCDKMTVQLERAGMLCEKLYLDSGIDDILAEDLFFVSSLKSRLTECDWDKVYELLVSYSPQKNKKKPTKKETDKYLDEAQLNADILARKAIADIRDSVKKSIRDDISKSICCSFDEVFADSQLSAELAQIIYDIVKHADKLINEEKLSRNGCDFADVELMTVSLLAKIEDGAVKRTELCEEMVASGEFGVILIDEFQDTNDLQDLIFKCISDTDDLEVLGKNVFVVGDIKQAIYGFRRSNPKLFLKARHNAGLQKYSSVLEEIVLSKNFRSRKNIIEFTNFLFSHLMSDDVGEVCYTEKEQLNFAADYDNNSYPTEFIICDDDEHSAVAAKIRSMIDSGERVCENGQYRSCRPGDFCILTRTKKHNFLLSQALENHGLKMSCREIDGYLRSREISLMISLLKVLDNPMNDLAMLAVMISPILSFTDDDAARLKTSLNKSGRLHLYQVLSRAQEDSSSISDALKTKCSGALERIKKFRYYASCLPIEQLIRKLYSETEFYILTASFTGGERAQANLRLLLEFASDYDSNSGGGLTGFLRYFDSVLSSGKDFRQAAAVTEETDSVGVMTMHKSKGLEFPFVFLLDLKREFSFDTSDSLLMSESGIGIRITDSEMLARFPTCAHSSIAIEQRASVISEELRLLYVAVTRAKERLFITLRKPGVMTRNRLGEMLSNAASAKALSPDIVSSAQCMLDWVLTACAFHTDGEKLLKELEVECPLLPVASECDIAICHAEDSATDESACCGSVISSETDTGLSSRIADVLSRPALQPDNGLAKVSVSEIVHPDKEKTGFYPQIPDLSKTDKRFSAAHRGTLTHRFMELCDFEKARASVSDELQRLVSQGRFSKRESEGIYLQALEKFFNGSFAARMMSSSNILREKEFMVKLSDLNLPVDIFGETALSDGMLQGIADCLFEENGSFVLVDYKTDKVDDLKQLADRYDIQLKLYKAALSLILDKPVNSCMIYSFYLGDSMILE